MLNAIFAGILAQYGMGEGQYVDTDMVGNAEVETAEAQGQIKNAEAQAQAHNAESQVENESAESVYEKYRAEELEKEIVYRENREKALRDVGFVLLKLYDVPTGIIECIDNDANVDIDAWIDEHDAEVQAMSFETVLYTESMFMCVQLGCMLAYESGNTRTGLKDDYADCCYYVARVSEMFNWDVLMRNAVKTMATEYRDGISECFIG